MISITHRHVLVPGLFIVASTLLISGCDSGPKLIPVTGSITVDGKPAEGATLVFHPSDPKTQGLATANAAADGKFSVISDMNPGINPGSYKVTVVWPDPAKKPTEAEKMTGMFEDAPDLLKGLYDTPAKSTLSATITDSSKELPPFELSTQ